MRKKFNVIGLLLCTFFVATSVMFSGGSNRIFANLYIKDYFGVTGGV